MKTILLILSILLVSCSSEAPIAVEQFQYREGDRLCVKIGPENQFVVLLEDVEPGRFAAFARFKAGNTGIVDIEYVVDYSECME